MRRVSYDTGCGVEVDVGSGCGKWCVVCVCVVCVYVCVCVECVVCV